MSWLVLAQPVVAHAVSQQEWMQQLVDTLGWGYGLPDAPLPEDYLKLLSGERSLRLEVEEGFRKTDLVSIKRLANFGDFSGSGWLSGRRETSLVHFDLLVPHGGIYTLTAATRQAGVKFQLAGREFVVDGGEKFSTQVLGEVELAAGAEVVKVTLPPNSGIDFLQLSAPSLPTVAPLGGWNLDAELTLDDVSITVVQALNLLSVLPETKTHLLFEAESGPQASGVEISIERHLGAISGGRWVRAGHQPASWNFSVTVEETGCYRTILRGVSSEPVELESIIFPVQKVFWGTAMKSEALGRICIPDGELSLRLNLPAWAGVDVLELRKLDTSSEMLSSLLGVKLDINVDEALVNKMLKLLSHLKY